MSDLAAFWFKFFMDAGIPASTSGIYAENFVKHRLKSSMMGDLDKNLLKDLGVDALGDCIAILKKAHNLKDEDLMPKNVNKHKNFGVTLQNKNINSNARQQETIKYSPKHKEIFSKLANKQGVKIAETNNHKMNPIARVNKNLNQSFSVQTPSIKAVTPNKSKINNTNNHFFTTTSNNNNNNVSKTNSSISTKKNIENTQKVSQNAEPPKVSIFSRLGKQQVEPPTPEIPSSQPTKSLDVFNRLGNKTLLKRPSSEANGGFLVKKPMLMADNDIIQAVHKSKTTEAIRPRVQLNAMSFTDTIINKAAGDGKTVLRGQKAIAATKANRPVKSASVFSRLTKKNI